MGVRVVFPDMGKDPSVQLIEKTITENGTYDAITDGANGYSKVNVNVQGGGGSSDFSTATMTVNATIDNTGSVIPPICALNMPTIAPQETATGYANVANGTTQYTVILYKGKAVAFSQNHGEKTQLYVTSSSGNVEYDEENMECIITGDCVLNVTNVQP